MKIILFCSFFLLFVGVLRSTSNEIIESDSIKEVFYEKQFLAHRSNNLDSAIYYCDQSIFILKKLNSLPQLTERYLDKARALANMNMIDSAYIYVEKSIVLSNKNNFKVQLGRGYAEKGGLFYDQFILDSALHYSLESYKILKGLKENITVATSILGLIYGDLNDPDNAMYYTNKTIEFLLNKEDLNFNDSTNLSFGYLNLGLAHYNLKDYRLARSSYLKAYEIGGAVSSYYGMAYTSSNLASLYRDTKADFSDLDSALYYIEQSKVNAEKCGFKSQQIIAEIFHGSVLGDQRKYNEAIQKFENAEKLAIDIGDSRSLENIYYNLVNSYISINSDSAIHYLSKYDSIKDVHLSELKVRSISDLEVKYKTAQKKAENKLLKKDLELKNQLIKTRTYIGIGIFMLLILGGFLVYFISRRKRDISEKQMLKLEQKLLRVQMNPHFIFNSLSIIGKYVLENKKEESYLYLVKFGKLMRLILESSREDFISLQKEVEIISNFLFLHKLRLKDKLEYEIIISDDLLKEEYHVPPMMLQPFIENSIQHGIEKQAETGVIKVHIYKVNEVLKLEVEDNGSGFERVELTKSSDGHKSYAIQITEERISNIEKNMKMKIKLSIENRVKGEEVNRGTKVSLSIG